MEALPDVNMATTEYMIRGYFDAGHRYEVIADMLPTFYGIRMSVFA